jgi:hypothetical protein
MTGLQDHFNPPLSHFRHWQSFHSAWATLISIQLNQHLPSGYFAEPNAQFEIEIDVATFEEPGAVAAKAAWSPAPPSQTVGYTPIKDLVEVLLYSGEGGPTLVGAIELVSPANKDRPESRDAFVTQCASYLQQGVGLVLVDPVTTRRANLHRELMERLNAADASASAAELYATAYRPVKQQGQPSLEVWIEPLAIGRPLPTLPLWLRGSLCLPIELQLTYERTCRDLRLAEGA